MNYFEFYDLPVSFNLDEKALKKEYIRKSKKFHPDFHTLASAENKERTLDMSTFNNSAFQTLSDREKRIAYVLDLEEILQTESKADIPQQFLVEMMDFNERLMELEMEEGDNDQKMKLVAEIVAIEKEIQSALEMDMDSYDRGEKTNACLQRIKDSYLKSKYVSRIRAQLGS